MKVKQDYEDKLARLESRVKELEEQSGGGGVSMVVREKKSNLGSETTDRGSVVESYASKYQSLREQMQR